MKSFINLLFVLFSLSAFAQAPSGFPFYTTQPISVSAGKVNADQRHPLIIDSEDFHRKGNPSSVTVTLYTAAPYSTSTAGNASTQYLRKTIFQPDSAYLQSVVGFVGDGKTFKAKEFRFSCDRPCRIFYNLKQGSHAGLANNPGTLATYNGVADKGKDWVHPSDQYFYSGATVVGIFYSTEKGQEWPRTNIAILGDEAPASLNPKAEKRILCIGNSITWTAWGVDNAGVALSYQTLFNNRIVADLVNNGVNVELDNKGYGSSDTRHMVNSIDNNHYAPNPDAILCFHGSNDMVNVAVADYKNNLKKLAAWRNRQTVKGPIFYFAPPATDRTGYAANYSAYVTATKEAFDEMVTAGETNIFYYDPADPTLGSNQLVLASDPTTDINFTNSNQQVSGTGNERLVNTRLHLWGGPNGGHQKIANGFLSKYRSTLINYLK